MRNDQQTLIAGPFEYFVEACELQSHDMHKADHEKLLLQPVSSPPSLVHVMTLQLTRFHKVFKGPSDERLLIITH